VTEMLIIDPDTRQFWLYRNRDCEPVAVPPNADGSVVLSTLDVSLATVDVGDGPRLRVDAGGTTSDC
jgi:hypothetical protein